MRLILTFLFTSLLWSAAFSAEPIFLLGVAPEVQSKSLNFYFELSDTASWSSTDVKFLKRTIEWDLQGVKLKKDKIFLNVGKQDINNIYISQNGNQTTRVRINLEPGKVASNYHDRLTFKKHDKQLILQMDGGVPLISNNINELNRTYDIESKEKVTDQIAGHIDSKSTLKVGAEDDSATANTSGENQALTEVTTVNDENRKESEIPLIAASTKNKDGSASTATRLILAMGILGVLLFSILVVNKKIQNKRAGAPFNHDSIKIVSQKYLGPKRCLTLVRVSGEYLLLGVTDHNISLVKSLSIVNDEIADLEPKDFGSTMNKMENQLEDDGEMPAAAKKSNRLKAQTNDDSMLDVEDRFTVSSLKDVKNLMKKRKYIDEADV